MTALRVVETGEVIEAMGRDEAQRVTDEIAIHLDSIAEHFETVMPLIREALTREAWKALDYRSVSEYVSIRFASAFARFPRDLRQKVVHELTAAGMSTRAIAPVFDVSNKTIHQDRQVLPQVTPDPDEETDTTDEWVSATTALAATQTPTPRGDAPTHQSRPFPGSDGEAPDQEAAPSPVRPSVIGLDGKRYQRQTPAPTPAVADDNWVVKNAEQRVEKFAEALATLELAQHPEARTYTREAFATHADAVRPAARALHTPQHIRATAEWLTLYAAELEGSRK